MKGKKGFIRVSSLLLGTMLLSILMYGVFNIFTTTSQAYPPFVKPGTPTPTPTATPTTPPGTPTPTPTQPPTIGKLVIQTIPQEDQLREKGIMLLCSDIDGTLGGYEFCDNSDYYEEEEVRDLHAEYKIDIRLNGENVHPDFFSCNIIEKEVCHIPSEKGVKEKEATKLIDVTNFFKCELNDIDKDGDGLPDGVGVMEVYYIGDADDARFIGDHIVKVEACVDDVCGAEIQDLCILGFPTCDWFGDFGDCTLSDKNENYVFSVRWSDKREDRIWKFADPLFPFASCKNAALWQREIAFPDTMDKTSVPDCTIIIP